MSYRALKWAVRVKTTPADKVILLVLAWHANIEGFGFPSVRTIAAETGYSTRTIRRALNKFEKQGLMEVSSAFGQRGRQTSNDYRLLLGKKPANLAPQGGAGCQGESDTDVTPRSDTAMSPLELTEEVKKEVRGVSVDNSRRGAGPRWRRAELWPKVPASLSRNERASVVRLLDEVPRDDAVLLIEELHGALRAKAITGSVVRWFEGLLRKYRQDKFKVHYASCEVSGFSQKRLKECRIKSLEGREAFLRVKERLLAGEGAINGE